MSPPKGRYELIALPRLGEAVSTESISVERLTPNTSQTPPPAARKPGKSSKTHWFGASAFAAIKGGSEHREEPKIALNRRFAQLCLTIFAHLVVVAVTVSIVQLSFRYVYCFDVEDSKTNKIQIRQWKIGLNEFLNALQFASKIHELLMVGSLSAALLHIVRILLMGKGLPFGLLTAGYSVGSVEYILSKAFWGSGFNRNFWMFSLTIAVSTLFANILGPSSAIAIIPNLDWWPVNDPYSGSYLPVGFQYSSSSQWPASLSSADAMPTDTDIYPADVCASSSFIDLDFCPAAGYNEINVWADAYANEGVQADLQMIDETAGAKRILTSRLTNRAALGKAGVAISTSVSHSFAVVMSSFWRFVKTRSYRVDLIARPRFVTRDQQAVLQPLVQVQCEPVLLHEFQYFRPDASTTNSSNSSDINTFSTIGNSQPHIWSLPSWLHDYNYNISSDIDTSTNNSYQGVIDLIWDDILDNNNASASIAAIVIAPFVGCLNASSCSQLAFAHTCTIDARWVASSPFFDPFMDDNVQHNLTDPLFFEKSNSASANVEKYGISPSIKINSTWASFLNVKTSYSVGNETYLAGAVEWILTKFVVPVSIDLDSSTSSTVTLYDFSPAVNLANNNTALNNADDVGLAASETIATVLGAFVTDGLARVASGHDYFIGINGVAGNITAINLEHFIGEQIYDSRVQVNLTQEAWNQNFPYELKLDVQRYGYGYGLRTKTVIFGITMLLMHTAVSLLYILYTAFAYFFKGGWTSAAWETMSELAAMLINSDKTHGLQNTCAGVETLHTWRQRVRIREIANDHLGLVVGDEKGKVFGQVVPQRRYGAVQREQQLKKQ